MGITYYSIYKNSTGNVGIGTITPANNLVVYNGSSWAGEDLNGSSGGELRFLQSGTLKANIYASTSTGFVINGGSETIFQIGASEKMRLTGGNLGIGTTGPASILHLNGAAPTILTLSSTSYPSTYYTTFGVDSAARAFLIFGNNGVNEIRAGRTSTGGYLDFYTNNTVGQTTTTSDGNFVMRLAAGGNVGIGTDAPILKLVVKGASSYPATTGTAQTGVFRLTGGTGLYNVLDMGINESTDTAWIQATRANSLSTYDKLLINPYGGNVGIGTTSPSYLLTVYAASLAQFTLSNATRNFILSNNAGDGLLSFSYNAVNRLQFDTTNQWFNTGNVGIGTSSPGGILDVQSSNAGDQLVRTWNTNTAGTGKAILRVVNSGNNAQGTQLQFTDLNYFVGTIASDRTNGMAFYVGQQATALVSERMRIDINGNLGIGTTSPAQKLTINNGSSTGAGAVYPIRLSGGTMSSVGDSTGLLFVQRDANDDYGGYIRLYTTVATPNYLNPRLEFGVQTTDTNVLGSVATRMVITGDGNVGIGTTSPDTILTLEKDITTNAEFGSHGHFSVRGKTNTSKRLDLGFNTYTDVGFIQAMINGTSYNNLLLNANGGNVGIGTTSPSAKLTVVQSAGADSVLLDLQSNNDPGIRFGRSSYGSLIRHISATTDYIAFNCNGASQPSVAATAQVVFDENGNVGIGVSAPNTKLTVWTPSTTGLQTALRLNNPFGFANANTGTKIVFSQDRTAAEDIPMSEMGVGQEYAGTSAAGYMFFSTLNNSMGERMRINSVGNVGIGTTSPTQKLEVNGTVLASAFSGPLTGNASTASTADGLNQNNNYTVSGFRANGTIYSGSVNSSYGGFQLNSDSHGLRRQDQTNDVYCYTTSGTLYLGAGGSSTTHIRVLSGGDVGIGVSPSYKLDVNGNIHATGFPTSSDIRFKKNITPLENSLEKIKKLQGVKYEWNEFVNSVRDGYKLNVPIIGLIAQDVEKIVPEVVDLWKLSEDCQDARSIDYPRLIPVLIEAIKEQQTIIENQNQKIENLIARMSALEAKQNL